MEAPADVEEVKVEIKKQTNTVDKATETDIQLREDINISREDLQLICENSEEAQNDSTTVEPTSEPCFDRETNEQEPNTPDSPSSAELCVDGDAADKNLSAKALQQRQAILAGVVGAVLLVSSVALCIMEMPVVVLVVEIVGLACVGLALYNTINLNTKLEKVESVKQPIVESSLNPT